MKGYSKMVVGVLIMSLVLSLCACTGETKEESTSEGSSVTSEDTNGGSSEETSSEASAEESESSEAEVSEETESSAVVDDSTEIMVDTETLTVTDTNGNEITSGSAEVSFSGTTKTISAAYLIDGVDVEITAGAYASASDSADEVVFLVINGGSLTITGSAELYVGVNKTGSAASGGQVSDDYNFYGINSGIVVAGSGSSAVIDYAYITTDANGANAVVATADASVTITNSVIATFGSAGSRGLHATYGGTITADYVNIVTQGSSCASLATDRGGGTIEASHMTLETNSAGSPLVYSTGTIIVSDSTGVANAAQMVVVEGGSSAEVNRCDFACTGGGNRTGTSESNADSHVIDAGGIFIYQSFSGDASDGTDYFTATDSTFTVTTAGVPMFYITNITAEITLEGNTFESASEEDYFLIAEETDQWGSIGSNGGNVTMTVTSQDLSGLKVFVGTSSSDLSLTATDASSTEVSKETGTW